MPNMHKIFDIIASQIRSQNPSLDVIAKQLEEYDINFKYYYNTVLDVAAAAGALNICQLMLEKCNPNQHTLDFALYRASNNAFIVDAAGFNNILKTCELLLQKGAKADDEHENSYLMTILFDEDEPRENLDAAIALSELLLRYDAVKVDSADPEHGYSILSLIDRYPEAGAEKIYKLLFKYRINPDVRALDEERITIITHLTGNVHLNSWRLLLGYDADLTIGYDGNALERLEEGDVFWNAVQEKFPQLLEIEAKRRAIEQAENSFFSIPSYHDSIEEAVSLIADGDAPNAKGAYGETVLHHAALNNQPNLAQFYIDEGVNVDEPDCYGKTALHRAIQREHLNVAKVLILAGASVHARCCIGKTPLNHIHSHKTKNTLQAIAVEALWDRRKHALAGKVQDSAITFGPLAGQNRRLEISTQKEDSSSATADSFSVGRSSESSLVMASIKVACGAGDCSAPPEAKRVRFTEPAPGR